MYETGAAEGPAAGAPEHEIEVTPEMIAAGVLELNSSNEEFENASDIVVKIYEAMNLARS